MNIDIQSVADKGNLDKERLILKVTADTDTGDYLVIQTGFSNGEVTIGTYNTFWFPYKAVSAGDLVVLYTKSGRENIKELKGSKKAHFFYWGLSSTLWGKNDRAPVLLHAPEWVSKAPDEI
ncbi:hypothetical protein BJL95_17225 [Methylomonas sp. LWB]|uniref:hypothetical protein n=1 Tax=Methylomonas sp. LWB TaxID=1905845 RepID=UPI0008DAD875|nr:hypothetical protein [Methylomonas sp. LWB]OHX34410.1 hypothetical protein BJL95_17225 [Methylomonas sp. LWB]